MIATKRPLVRRLLPPPAFTLIELLVVIAIMAVLAALIMATVSGAVKKGNAAKCMGNLRQIYLISQAFSLEHDGHTPPAWWWKYDGYGDTLDRYGFDGKKMACPDIPKTAPDLSYGISINTVWNGVDWGDHNINFNTHGPYRFLAYPKPAATAFFFDALPFPGRTYARYFGGPEYADYRHGKRCNMIFMDGHGEALLPEALPAAFSADLLPDH